MPPGNSGLRFFNLDPRNVGGIDERSPEGPPIELLLLPIVDCDFQRVYTDLRSFHFTSTWLLDSSRFQSNW